jgi:hypothetical protein
MVSMEMRELLLVGSVPLQTPERVLRTCGDAIGEYVTALPDGEVGDRINWVDFLALRTYRDHPDIEVVQQPSSVLSPSTDDHWTFRVKPGVQSLRFDALGYADEAIVSYSVFRRMRADGTLPPHLRFQVGLPTPGSGIDTFFRDPADWPIVKPAYTDAVRAEVHRMLEAIPADDLVIQWDFCGEILNIMGPRPWAPQEPFEARFQRAVEPLAELSYDIPEATLVGYHWCYGTLGGWPMVELRDLGLCARLSQHVIDHSGRQIDYVHMPVGRECDAGYFAPLRDLELGDTKLFLGVIHHADGVAGFRERVAIARRAVPEFGIASVCGYGRVAPAEMPTVLQVHHDCAEAFRAGAPVT